MQSIRTFFLTVSGFAVIAILALFTASLTVAFAGILAVLMAGRMVAAKLKPVPVRARKAQQPEMRVWNDGRGTIIDL